jgi:uncharacterized protein YndB with AHSA1/START domain
MSNRSATHSTFVIERTYEASPARVFAAWADKDAKGQWFGPPGDQEHELDFSEGGRERFEATVHGAVYSYDALYEDIVPDERIVYTTALFTDEVLSTVSLTTVRFARDGDGTRLVLTEQGTFLDDQEQPEWREQGTGDWLDALGRQVAQR